MAGRKLIIQSRVRASTILEVLISMIVIIVVFGIAMMIFANVSRLSLSAQKMKAAAILQERLLSAEQNTINLDETVTIGEFQVEQEVKTYDKNDSLFEIHLTAWDGNRVKVVELQKVIINP